MCSNTIIANQRARWGRSRHKIRRAQQVLRQQRFPFSLVTTDRPGHARELAGTACQQNADTIIVLGGDGTVNEVINGILTAGCRHMPRIGIIPIGSSNDFSRSLGISQNLHRACQTIIRGKTRHIDVGQAGPHYFCMASCMGLFADIAAASMDMKGLHGSLRYITAALRVIRSMSAGWRMNIQADAMTFHDTYGVLLVGNTSRFGGLTLVPQAQPDDGIFDCLLIEMVNKWEALSLIPLALTQALTRHQKVTRFQARSLSLSINPQARLCNDGEVYAETFQDIQYRILPQKLPIIC
jgi:diacylglycerol kinase (ATP)